MEYKSGYSLPKKLATAVAITVVLLLGLAILAIVQTSQKKDKVVVELYKVPRDLKVTINDSLVSGSTAYLKPGKYSIKGESDGFKAFFRTIELTASDKESPVKVLIALSPETDTAKQWAKENQSLYREQEELAGSLSNKESAKSIEKFPIIKDLPYRSDLYNIEYYNSGDEFRVQIITFSGAMGRQVAIAKIRSLGYDPADYKIEFVGFDNPFADSRVGDNNE